MAKKWKFDKTKLATVREVKSLTQEEVADLIAVSRQSYNTWEVGVTQPSVQSIEKLCDKLDIKPMVLFTEMEIEEVI